MRTFEIRDSQNQWMKRKVNCSSSEMRVGEWKDEKRKVGQLAADLGELADRVYIKLSHIRRPCRRVDAATPP